LYGKQNLKDTIAVTERSVECPVKGCRRVVERQRHHFCCDASFLCPDHQIYISPSTFEYSRLEANILWQRPADLSLLEEVIKAKSECRMARDNSEDAVTWNMFRYLEISDQLSGLLSHIAQTPFHSAELIYWSYSAKTGGAWPELNTARLAFGENPEHGSEPDLIAVTDKAIFFIEAKLTATNDTQSRHNGQNYLDGGTGWYKQVFRSDFDMVAVQARKYELLRFCLLGSWLAKEMKKDFYLINIVLAEREQDIEARFLPHVITDDRRHFMRLTWENLYGHIIAHAPPSQDKETLDAYFQNKTIGYRASTRTGTRTLLKAFSIS